MGISTESSVPTLTNNWHCIATNPCSHLYADDVRLVEQALEPAKMLRRGYTHPLEQCATRSQQEVREDACDDVEVEVGEQCVDLPNAFAIAQSCLMRPGSRIDPIDVARRLKKKMRSQLWATGCHMPR